jgi:lipopolysaccharide transport system ATP-binding protein
MDQINVEGLSKLYYLGERRSNSLRDALTGFFGRPGSSSGKGQMWALKDVSFGVDTGDTLGIIGRNGAGKSTLLKILSRITKPTSGNARIRGRVGSLLEVGTGFHNELSGRENIYLNGAILGMKRVEIDSKFDEIVAFSEIERFLDTPVKHYSSGMYMRLAFSVAAHLEPEVLIVDEVLAVGDAAFQRKCLNKMRDVSQQGRTVLFVSHDMQAIGRLCTRVLWLNQGQVRLLGAANEVISTYLQEELESASSRTWGETDAPGNTSARLHSVSVRDEIGKEISAADIRRPVIVQMEYEVLESGKVLMPNFHLYNDRNECVFVSHDLDPSWRSTPRQPGIYISKAIIPGNFLAEGTFFITPALTTYEPFNVHFIVRDAVSFYVKDSIDGDTARGDYAGQMPGAVRPILDWKTEFEQRSFQTS